MKHKIIDKQNLLHPYLLLEVELIPETEQERKAIQKVDAMDADEQQKELIENFLLFGLGIPYSVIAVERQNNSKFILKVSSI